MKSADLVIRNCTQLLTCRGPLPKRKTALQELGLIENGWIASYRGMIVFVGEEKDFRKEVLPEKNCTIIDGDSLTCLPGFVDSHTHLPFSGSREEEFMLRLKGYTYQELTEKGMGIKTTVRATRQASRKQLVSLCLARLNNMLSLGTTTVEAKSGYGLNLTDEIKQLEALRKLDGIHPVDIVPTFMGAHEIPEEFSSRKEEYIDLIINKLIPEVKAKKLAEFFDVFCEEGVFSLEDTKRLARAARQAGFKLKVHADEFAPLGGAKLAAEEGATSADHLINITQEGMEKLAQSSTAATLLPAVSFFLMLDKKAPARELIDGGAIVALATDFNPGSSMTESMLFVLQLAVFTLRISIEEAINASTANAAYALDRHESVGSLEVGKKMDLILCDCPNYPFLVYHLGINHVKHVIKNGRVVVEEGTIKLDSAAMLSNSCV